ncbi:hypothetical protein D4764_10G0010800 [Takifugu flavidus]|uniref:Uncharacterized protein n=1 Tax=Takifugu flavidus TaxID=433684 RepID=A0A5C6PP79_9TELE|nr:hypothetical protein D4764_10G0010800 [Takifugu flavidus]
MPKPPHLAPLNAEEQRLYSELLPDGRASHSISKGRPLEIGCSGTFSYYQNTFHVVSALGLEPGTLCFSAQFPTDRASTAHN